MPESDDDDVIDPSSASARQLRDQIRYSLLHLIDGNNKVTQETLALVMGYAGQSSVSKILNDNGNLTPSKAAALDEQKYSTGTPFTWEQLATAHRAARQRITRSQATNAKYDVFLASPMASASKYGPARDTAMDLAETIENRAGLTVYYAGRSISSEGSFDSPDVAFDANVKALENSRHFVLLLTKKLTKPSSVWVEAGMALAMGLESTYFVPDPESLPYILNRARLPRSKGGSVTVSVHWIARDPQIAFNLVRNHKADLFRNISRGQGR